MLLGPFSYYESQKFLPHDKPWLLNRESRLKVNIILVYLKPVAHVMLTISVPMLQDLNNSGQYTILHIMQCKNLVTTRETSLQTMLKRSWKSPVFMSLQLQWGDVDIIWFFLAQLPRLGISSWHVTLQDVTGYSYHCRCTKRLHTKLLFSHKKYEQCCTYLECWLWSTVWAVVAILAHLQMTKLLTI